MGKLTPRVPQPALAQYPDEQHPRTTQPRDTPENTGCRLLPGRRIRPDACLRKAKACRLEGMGHQEVPEHEAPLRAGKGKRTKTGTGKERTERTCSLNLMLEQTIFAKKP